MHEGNGQRPTWLVEVIEEMRHDFHKEQRRLDAELAQIPDALPRRLLELETWVEATSGSMKRRTRFFDAILVIVAASVALGVGGFIVLLIRALPALEALSKP